jgi:sulfonate transport system permease protein
MVTQSDWRRRNPMQRMVADPAAGYTAAAMAVPANEACGLEEFGLPRAGSELHAAWQKWRLVLLRGLGPLLLLAAWQITAMYGLIPPEILPAPLDIVAAFRELIARGELQAALEVSLARAGLGLAIGGATGLVLGLFAGLWRIGEALFDAPLQMLRTIPFIALVPLFITWFGIEETSKVVIIAAAVIFPMYLNTYAGVRGVDPKLIEAATIFGLTPRQTMRHVIIPTALPSILVGLRYAAGVSLLALVVAEQINAQSGIGYILTSANMAQRLDLLIAGILVYAALGVTIDVVMRAIERTSLSWMPSTPRL